MSLVTTFFIKQLKLLYKEGSDISQKLLNQGNVIEILTTEQLFCQTPTHSLTEVAFLMKLVTVIYQITFEKAFPCRFPYGMGGHDLEADRQVEVEMGSLCWLSHYIVIGKAGSNNIQWRRVKDSPTIAHKAKPYFMS